MAYVFFLHVAFVGGVCVLCLGETTGSPVSSLQKRSSTRFSF